MMGMRIIAPVAASIALLSLAAGCGGGDSGGNEGGGQTAAVLSKAAFIKKADSICSEADKRTESEFAAYAKENKIPAGGKPSSAQYAAITKTILIPALHRQVNEIHAVGLPQGDEARIEKFLGAVGTSIEQAEEEPAAAAESPRKLLAGADKIVAGYGFKVCG